MDLGLGLGLELGFGVWAVDLWMRARGVGG